MACLFIQIDWLLSNLKGIDNLVNINHEEAKYHNKHYRK